MRGRAPGHSESHMSHAHTLLFSNNARRRTQREIHGPNHSLNLTLAALQQINNFIGKCTQMPQIYLFFFSNGKRKFQRNPSIQGKCNPGVQSVLQGLGKQGSPTFEQSSLGLPGMVTPSVLGVGRQKFYCLGFTDVGIWVQTGQDHTAFEQQDCGSNTGLLRQILGSFSYLSPFKYGKQMDQVGQPVCLVPVAFKALSITKRRTQGTSLSPRSVFLVIPGKFKPCVLLKKTSSVQCKGKTSLESRRCRQNVL